MASFSVLVRPIPSGLSRDEILAEVGSEGKGLRFGSGRGVAGDYMIVDFFTLNGAKDACARLNGSRVFGKRVSCELTQATKDNAARTVVSVNSRTVKIQTVRESAISAESMSYYAQVGGFVVYDLKTILKSA